MGQHHSGIDLTRRLNRQQVFGLTLPLVTKADGTKFGKTETGTIWLDPGRTSPYAFYQFWVNTADADVYRFLRYFTFLSVDDIVEIERSDGEIQGRKSAQGILAREVTRLVHGEDGLEAAERITAALFSGDSNSLSEADFESLRQDGLSSSALDAEQLEKPLTTLLVDHGLAASGKQVKDALGRGAVVVNDQGYGLDDNNQASVCFARERARYGRYFITRLGKKKYHLFYLA